MAAACAVSATSFPANEALFSSIKFSKKLTPRLPSLPTTRAFRIRAAKLPSGVEVPRVQPKLSEPFLGFTKTAEIWNSRACMIGLIGTFIVELVLNKGILQMIGVEICSQRLEWGKRKKLQLWSRFGHGARARPRSRSGDGAPAPTPVAEQVGVDVGAESMCSCSNRGGTARGRGRERSREAAAQREGGGTARRGGPARGGGGGNAWWRGRERAQEGKKGAGRWRARRFQRDGHRYFVIQIYRASDGRYTDRIDDRWREIFLKNSYF